MRASITRRLCTFCKMLGRVALLPMCAMWACGEPSAQTLSSALSLRTLSGCAFEPLPVLVVEALGDFPQSARAVKAVSFTDAPARLAGFPLASRLYRMTAESASFRAAALGPAADDGQRFDALLLPLSRPCSVLDALPTIPEESAQALVMGTDLLTVGGAGPMSTALREGFVLEVAGAEARSLEAGLLVPRAGARAVALARETWILGGVPDLRQGSVALDSFERFDAATQRFLDRPGRMREGRYAAAALALWDGSVLVAGGFMSVGAQPLSSIEIIAPGGERSTAWSEELPFSAAALALAARDDGRVLALAAHRDAPPELALLDPQTQGVVALPAPRLAKAATLEPALVAPLPGARVALFEVDDAGRTTGRLFLQTEADYLTLPDPEDPSSDWLASFEGVAHGRALALRDGRILLTGVRDDAPLARIINPQNREVSVRPLDRVIDALFMRDDGSVLFVGEGAAQVFREDSLTPFDNPGGTLIADDSSYLSLDAYGRFEREGLGLRARVAGARFDLAPLRYADMRLVLQLSGEATVLLRREDGGERAIDIAQESVGPAFCVLERGDATSFDIERRGEQIILRVGDKKRVCRLDGMLGPLAVGVVATEEGTLIRDLRIERR